MLRIVRYLTSDYNAIKQAKIISIKLLAESRDNDAHCALHYLVKAAKDPSYRIPDKFSLFLSNYGLTSIFGVVDSTAVPLILGAIKLNREGIAEVDFSKLEAEG